ncbi:MAG TPA: hypothetical protein VMY69_08835, partial [Phycisphaerae bacterium]|nr:hypothetical protein [Phycisphaerae bacterium]
MTRLVAVLFLLEGLLLIPMTGGCGKQGEDITDYWAKAENVTPQRLEKIEKALASKGLLVSRALLESVPLVANEPRLARAILDHAPYSLNFDGLAVRALG